MRFLVMIVVTLAAIVTLIAVSARLSMREELIEVWPAGLGSIRNVPHRYPAHPTTPAARRLTALGASMGLQLGATGEKVVTVRLPRELDKQFIDYVYAQLEKPDDSVDAPPQDVTKALSEREQALGDVTRLIDDPQSPIDWRDDIHAQERIVPPLHDILVLGRLLAAHALIKHDASSWDDVHALVVLARPLWSREDSFSASVAVSTLRLANGVARKLPPPVPAWWREVAEIDARHAVLESYQAESWTWSNWTENWRRSERGAMLLTPLFDVSLASLLNRRRAAAEEFASSRACAFDADRWNLRWKLPDWNMIGQREGPEAGGYEFQRAAVFDFERGATERVLAIKEHRPPPVTSRCSDGTWSYANGTLQFSLTAIPLPPRSYAAVPTTLHY